jgi:hypothetical protein
MTNYPNRGPAPFERPHHEPGPVSDDGDRGCSSLTLAENIPLVMIAGWQILSAIFLVTSANCRGNSATNL